MLNTILSMIFLNSQYIFLFILPHNTFSKLIIYFCYSFVLSYFFWIFMSIFGKAFKFTLSTSATIVLPTTATIPSDPFDFCPD